jgi:alpha-tubulin suppressor-like RCC1 family protein
VYHGVAINLAGNVRAWGNNGYGGCVVPTDLGVCTAIAAGYHTVALRPDGIVRAWGGDNKSGQCDIPGDLGVCTSIAAGKNHTVALQQNGVVRAWGENGYGQSYVPADLGVCTAISAAEYQTVALGVDTFALVTSNTELPAANASLAEQRAALQAEVLAKTTALGNCETSNAALTTQVATQSRGDSNGDGTIGQTDLQRLFLHWGPSSAAENSGDLKAISRSVKSVLKAIKLSRRR